MKIHVYATLKDHFQPEFELDGIVKNTEELKTRLGSVNANAAELLKSCRFAIEEGFIDHEYKLHQNDTVIIIPPSSGG
jgi:sulfur-carrier protein